MARCADTTNQVAFYSSEIVKMLWHGHCFLTDTLRVALGIKVLSYCKTYYDFPFNIPQLAEEV